MAIQLKTSHKVGGGISAVAVLGASLYAAIINQNVAFTPTWEGMDKVARFDRVGTGHPLTWCYGQTPADATGVVPGQKFTKVECDAQIKLSLPKYLDGTVACYNGKLDARQIPVKVWSALTDGSYNAGFGAVCKSPMMKRLNAGDIKGACNAFVGWYISGAGHVVPGLIARRSGRPGDARKSERDLCLEGIKEGPYVPPVEAGK